MGDCLRFVASFNIARYVGVIYRLIYRPGRTTGEGTRARRKRRWWSSPNDGKHIDRHNKKTSRHRWQVSGRGTAWRHGSK